MAMAVARHPALLVLRPSSNFYVLPSFGASWGKWGTNRGRFSLGFVLKTPLGRNTAVSLGSFLDCIFQALGFHLLQSIYAKFLFPFSLFISCLFLLLLLNIVDLVYVYSKCLAFILISCLLLAFIHVRLGFFSSSCLFLFVGSLGFNFGFIFC